MHFAALIGQRENKKWKRAAGAALTAVLLSAVAAEGFSLLGSELFAAWNAPANAGESLAAGSAFGWLLNFEAPARTVFRDKVQTEETEQSFRSAGNTPLFLKNWQFTQNPIADIFLSLQMAINNYMAQIQQIEATVFASVASYVNAILTAYANFVNSILIAFTPVNNTNNTSSSSSSHSASPHH